MISRRAFEAAEPALRQDGLDGVGLYWYYRSDDARLVLETGLAARRLGCPYIFHHQADQ